MATGPPFNPPKSGDEFEFHVALEDYANPGNFKASPTIAAGDCKISKDAGALANVTNIPTNTPAGSVLLYLGLTETEMTAEVVTIVFIDQTSPKEWSDLVISIPTS